MVFPLTQNIMSILNTPGTPSRDIINAVQGPTPQPAPRQRRSILDTIGGIADVFATVGGAQPLYQPTIDARQNRQFAIEDRQRALEDRERDIELDSLRKQQLGQQIKAGGVDLENDLRSRTATALGAIADVPNAAEIWPQIAQQAGIPEAQAAAIGQELQRNPGIASRLAASLGLRQVAEGSQAKELQTYRLLMQEDPSGQLGRTYLQSIANPDGLTEYQRAQLDARFRGLDIQERRANAAISQGNRRVAVAERKPQTGGAKSSGKAAARAAQIPAIVNALNTLESSIEPLEQSGYSGAILGNVPGVLDAESDVFETNRALVQQLIRGLTKVEGEGSISDYETRLQQATLPSRTQTPEGRRQSIANLRALVRDLQRSYTSPGRSTSQRRQAPAPRRPAASGNSSGWSVVGVE